LEYVLWLSFAYRSGSWWVLTPEIFETDYGYPQDSYTQFTDFAISKQVKAMLREAQVKRNLTFENNAQIYTISYQVKLFNRLSD
jgi:hypothetical protein